MPERKFLRLVIDTNVFVSRCLHTTSISCQAVLRAEQDAVVLVSRGTLTELAEVLGRPRLDKFVSAAHRMGIFRQILRSTTLIESPPPIRACRDPKDDKFLEVAVSGRADAILTWDRDLLDLHPFRGIAILTPAHYLALK